MIPVNFYIELWDASKCSSWNHKTYTFFFLYPSLNPTGFCLAGFLPSKQFMREESNFSSCLKALCVLGAILQVMAVSLWFQVNIIRDHVGFQRVGQAHGIFILLQESERKISIHFVSIFKSDHLLHAANIQYVSDSSGARPHGLWILVCVIL